MAWGSGGRKSYGGNKGGSNNSAGGGKRSNFQSRNSGGGNRGRSGGSNYGGGRGRGQQQNSQFEQVTGLFPSKSGNAHTVFVTPEILACLQAIKEGDMLCVSPRKDSDMLNFSVMLGEDNDRGGDSSEGNQG